MGLRAHNRQTQIFNCGSDCLQGTSTIASDTSTSSQVYGLACEDYSNTISILGSASIVQATAAWLRGVCGLECLLGTRGTRIVQVHDLTVFKQVYDSRIQVFHRGYSTANSSLNSSGVGRVDCLACVRGWVTGLVVKSERWNIVFHMVMMCAAPQRALAVQ